MDVFSPLTLPCGLCLKNRLLRAAAFSGETVPAAAESLGEAARGGCALVTLAYTSVSADGRTFPSQFVLSEASAPPDFPPSPRPCTRGARSSPSS
jgi:2,4-dienoyl-CoA reductase-like NADH-dependent reductase (Old Yellow Enzyme family)